MKKELIKDGWRKPGSIYRSFFGSGVLTVGVIAIVCLVVVVVCHLFETPPLEANTFADVRFVGVRTPRLESNMGPQMGDNCEVTCRE